MTKEQHSKFEDFNKNPDIVTRKADRTNVFVILEPNYSKEQLDHVNSDTRNFRKIYNDPTVALKRELYELIKKANSSSDSRKVTRREGVRRVFLRLSIPKPENTQKFDLSPY